MEAPEPKLEAPEPRKYMTAADFDKRVCSKLSAISESYSQTALRYEAAITKTEKTIKTCEMTTMKIERFNRISQRTLNDGFTKIGTALVKDFVYGTEQQ